MGSTPPTDPPRNGEDRARALLDGMAQFMRSFKSPQAWGQMPEQEFKHMVFLACLTFERHPERAVRMFRMFAEFARRFGVSDRMNVLQTLVAFIEEGRASADALLPFVYFDQGDTLITAASREFALLHPSPASDPTAGARTLLERVDAAQMLKWRRGAVMAGLLMLGDMRLAPVLTGRCGEFASSTARRIVAGAMGVFATRLHVEFLLDWLEHAPTAEDAVAAAQALAQMPHWCVDTQICDLSRVLPSTAAPAGDELEIKERWTFPAYLTEIRPRLAAVAMMAEWEGDGSLAGLGPVSTTATDTQRVRAAIQEVMDEWSALEQRQSRAA